MTLRSKSLPLLVALVGIAALLFLALRQQSRSDAPPGAPPPAPTPAAQVPRESLTSATTTLPPVPPTPTSTPPAQAETPSKPGRIIGTIVVPPSVTRWSFRIYIFTPSGTETDESFDGVTNFILDDIKPGRKAVVLLSPSGDLGTASAVIQVVQGNDTPVTLSPPAPTFLEGQVVDAEGKAAAGLLVTWNESLPVQELYPQGKPRNTVASGSFGGPIDMKGERKAPAHYFLLDPANATVTRSALSDQQGRFKLSLTSDREAVKVRVLKDLGHVLKEESVVPGGPPLRLVLPSGTK
jgi:hypothetical protein